MQRSLNPEVKTYLNTKVQVAAHDATGVLPAWQYMVLAAQACLGIESGNPLVVGFQSVVGPPSGQAWCLDFVQSMIAWVEGVKGLKSPLTASQGVLEFWRGNLVKTLTPSPGDIVCYEFGTTGLGHCGIVVGNTAPDATLSIWQTIEGNTTPSGIIERTGDGVYLKSRKRGGSDSFRELGFLRPFP